MNIFAKHINVSDLLSVTVLSNRATARSLVDEMNEINKKKVKLDFSDVEFASRSFMDELNSQIRELDNIKILKINMNDQVAQMDDLVQDEKVRASWLNNPKNRSDSDLVTM